MCMKPFCETIVIEVLPTVRALMAKKLSDRGKKNKEIAALMQVTPAAVTQYLKKSRGSRVKILMKNKAVNTRIDELADKMVDKGLTHTEEVECFCEICKEVRKERILCELHGGPDSCKICLPKGC